jgi:hypothetical protein
MRTWRTSWLLLEMSCNSSKLQRPTCGSSWQSRRTQAAVTSRWSQMRPHSLQQLTKDRPVSRSLPLNWSRSWLPPRRTGVFHTRCSAAAQLSCQGHAKGGLQQYHCHMLCCGLH